MVIALNRKEREFQEVKRKSHGERSLLEERTWKEPGAVELKVEGQVYREWKSIHLVGKARWLFQDAVPGASQVSAFQSLKGGT